MLIIDNKCVGVVPPLSIDHEFVFVSACMKGETDTEEHFSILPDLATEFIKSLPPFPAACDEDFMWDVIRLWFPNEIGFLGGTVAIVYVSTLRTDSCHRYIILYMKSY